MRALLSFQDVVETETLVAVPWEEAINSLTEIPQASPSLFGGYQQSCLGVLSALNKCLNFSLECLILIGCGMV